MLEVHPEVCVSSKKEVDFFTHYFDHGYQWYENQFSPAGTEALMGEISPSYFCSRWAPERIYRYMPDARVLLSVRDPIERLLSNHRHEVQAGHLRGPDLSVEAGLANNPMYVEQGRYATHLKNWLQYFPMDQMLVVFMEDVISDPVATARAVYGFLGVDADYVPDHSSKQYNRSFANRSLKLAALKDSVYSLTRSPAGRWIWDLAGNLGLKSAYRRFNTLPSEQVIPPPEPETLAHLRKVFAPEVAELGELTGRSLTKWLS
jgi:hypothetical protein